MRSAPDWRFLAVLAGITFLGPLAVHIFLPAMPTVRSEFGVSDAVVGLTFSITLFVMAFATLVYGSLSDRYGRRPVLLVGVALFIAGSVLSAMAGSIYGLIAGRILQALGAGCGVALARVIAKDAYGASVLVKVIAYLTMAYAVGPLILPFMGGVLLDTAGWRSVFWFAAISGALIMTAVWLLLYETHGKEDIEPKAAGFLRDYARLFSRARFDSLVLQSGFSSGCFYTMAAASSFLMKDYLGRSATEFGMYFVLFPAGFFLGTSLSSRLSQRFGMENVILAGSIINVLSISGQSAWILAGDLTPLVLFVPGFFITFGQGIALPNTQVGAMRVIPSLSGTAAGIGAFCQTFMGALFAQLYAVLADGTPIPMVVTLMTCSILTLSAGIVPFALKERDVEH